MMARGGRLTSKAWEQIALLLSEKSGRGDQWKDHRKSSMASSSGSLGRSLQLSIKDSMKRSRLTKDDSASLTKKRPGNGSSRNPFTPTREYRWRCAHRR